MDNRIFEGYCKKLVVGYHNSVHDGTMQIKEDDVFVVWLCKILGNNKALCSTKVSDGRYYEITYNGERGETYVDVYKKECNYVADV